MTDTDTTFDALASSRVLLTGASGFIGSHLGRRLLELGAEVHAVSRRPREDPGEGWHWHRADLADFEAAREVVTAARPDYVFHLASHVAGSRDLSLIEPTFRDNLATTVSLLLAVQPLPLRRFVLTGSLEEPASALAAPSSPYAAAKWAASAYARLFHALYELPAVVARVFMVYGPDQKDLHKLVPYVTLSLLKDEVPSLGGGGREVDWIYVDDLVEGLLALAVAPGIEGDTLDLGSGELVAVRRVVEILYGLLERPEDPPFGTLPDRPMEQIRVADTAETCKKTGWRPATPLRAGLTRTVAWYRDWLERQ